MKPNDFIHSFPSLTNYICQGLINTFKEHEPYHIKRYNEVQSFTELNLNLHVPVLVSALNSAVLQARDHYVDVCTPITPLFPKEFKLESFRIKRYNEGEGFKSHVDVACAESCPRFLAFLFYLNDDFEGGNTHFRTPDLEIIKPVTGNVLVFPPTWQYPHEGTEVTKGTKYIMSAYLHYT